jgi:catechol 2,3-dioxygenase
VSTTADLYGRPESGDPATAGSYGLAPGGFRLQEETRLGPVTLQVSDLGRSLAYYQTVLGLRMVRSESDRAALSPRDDDRILVELHELNGARPAARRSRLGLFHYAILLPDRAALGRFVKHLADSGLSAGAADHLVSEALYLYDPDGLGIEVYADRPRETWRRIGRELMMSSDPLDLDDLVRAGGEQPWIGMPAGTVMGHVHLHVGDLEQGGAYFSDALGFDRITWRYPGALFLSAGGYHHHLGTNVWAGPSARPPEPNDARLLEWTIEVPGRAGVEGAAASLAAHGHPADGASGGDLLTADPWGTAIRLTTK